jgi:hypothetical protein
LQAWCWVIVLLIVCWPLFWVSQNVCLSVPYFCQHFTHSLNAQIPFVCDSCYRPIYANPGGVQVVSQQPSIQAVVYQPTVQTVVYQQPIVQPIVSQQPTVQTVFYQQPGCAQPVHQQLGAYQLQPIQQQPHAQQPKKNIIFRAMNGTTDIARKASKHVHEMRAQEIHTRVLSMSPTYVPSQLSSISMEDILTIPPQTTWRLVVVFDSSQEFKGQELTDLRMIITKCDQFETIDFIPVVRAERVSGETIPKIDELAKFNIKALDFADEQQLVKFIADMEPKSDRKLKFFISYRRKSYEGIVQLYNVVKKSTHMEVFFDEESIKPGDNWLDHLCCRMLEALNAIMILNHETFKSMEEKLDKMEDDNVLIEWELACFKEKLALLVLTDMNKETAVKWLERLANKYQGKYHTTRQIMKTTGIPTKIDKIMKYMAENPMLEEYRGQESQLQEFLKEHHNHDGAHKKLLQIGMKVAVGGVIASVAVGGAIVPVTVGGAIALLR